MNTKLAEEAFDFGVKLVKNGFDEVGHQLIRNVEYLKKALDELKAQERRLQQYLDEAQVKHNLNEEKNAQK